VARYGVFVLKVPLNPKQPCDDDNWSYKTCKCPVNSSPPTNQHPNFYRPDAFPVDQPTVSKHWRMFGS